MMRVSVKKSGSDASIGIPAAVMAAASLHVDQAVELRAGNGRIVIEAVKAVEYDLDQLLDARIRLKVWTGGHEAPVAKARFQPSSLERCAPRSGHF